MKWLLLGICLLFLLFICLFSNQLKNEIIRIEKKSLESKIIREMMMCWNEKLQSGRSLEEYFLKRGYNKIAIYGMGDIGQLFYSEIKKTRVNVEYVLDMNAGRVIADIPVYYPKEGRGEVDVVVVTPIQYYETIKSNINDTYKCPIVSLEDVVFD